MGMYTYIVTFRAATGPGGPACNATISVMAESQAQAVLLAAQRAADKALSVHTVVSVTRRPIP